ncbi:MAG: rhodanese-like domain-containing protein [Raoultibacter sp.]
MVEFLHHHVSSMLIGILVVVLAAAVVLTGCSASSGAGTSESVSDTSGVGASLESLMSTQGVSVIKPEQTKQIMEQYPAALLIDVREASEYAQGHIPGAFLLPLNTITSAQTADTLRAAGLDKAAQEKGLASAEDASALIVYCRSGVRSANAAQHLSNLGFSPVLDAGGINSWPYDIEK